MSNQEKNIKSQVIALAAVAQAATLIDKLARTGYNDNEPFKTLVHGLLETNPSSTEAIFIDTAHLRCGLETLNHLLQQGDVKASANTNYTEIMRLSLSMLHLQRKLVGNKSMLDNVSEGIEKVKRQVDHFDDSYEPNNSEPNNYEPNGLPDAFLHQSVLASMASIYEGTLSTLRFRVQVNGNPTYLQQENVVHKIRSLLLCGIRAAVLWQQVGGNRLTILFKRKQYAEMGAALLKLY